MIASLRGLIVLAAMAVLLAIALLVGTPAAPVTDRTLVPEFTPGTSVTFSYAGKPDVTVVDEGGRWIISDSKIVVEGSAVDAALAAVRGATWHRRAAAAIANRTRGGITNGSTKILVGREVAGSAQTWLVIGDQALLVDSWVAHALLPDPLELRVRQPLSGAPGAASIRASGVRVEGRFQAEPVKRWLAEPAYTELVTALVDLTIVSLDGMHPAPGGRSIAITPHEPDSIEMTEAGTCDGDRVRVETRPYGDGCLERAAWQRALAAFEPLARLDAPSLVDTRIVPFTPVSVKFRADDTELKLSGRAQIGTDDADLDRVRELLAALATSGTIVPRPTLNPRMLIDARGPTESVQLSIFDGVVARADEPFALRPPPEAFAMITRPVSALRDPILWREEVTTLSTFTLDGITYARGAVIGEWTRTPAGTVDAALVDSLAETLSRVRAPTTTAPATIAHTITVTFTPPTGAPTTHTLELGTPTHGGCAARVDRKPVRLDLSLCMAVVALAAVR